MSQHLRILIVIDSLKVGGAEVLMVDFVRACIDARHAVQVLYFTPGPLAEDLAALGVETTRLSTHGLGSPLPVVRAMRRIRSWRPHIVHTHLRKSDLAGQLAARLCGVSARVSTAHNTDPWRRRPLLSWLERATMGRCQRIAVSDEVAEHMRSVGGCDPGSLITIRNGIDTSRFDPARPAPPEFASRLGLAPADRLVGIVGRLEPQKDHATFVEAACRVGQDHTDAKFVIVGDGPLRRDIERACERSGQAERFVFAGVQRDMPGVFAALDVVVFSSRWEGLPVALLEAMSMARPVVATRVGGIAATLDDAGVVVAPGDAAALGRAISALLSDPERSARLGARGRERVCERFSQTGAHRATFALYRRLTDAHEGHQRA